MTTSPKPRSLRKIHAEGVRCNQEADHRDGVWYTLEALGARTSAKRNRLMEARRFATMCDKAELSYLCRLGSESGKPISWTHVLQLMRVQAPKRRKQLAARCAANAWTTRELQRQVDRIAVCHEYGGGKHKPPQSVDEALRVTARMAASWKRWVDVLKEDNRIATGKRRRRNQLPNAVCLKLVGVRTLAKGLEDEIKQVLGKSSKVRKRIRSRAR